MYPTVEITCTQRGTSQKAEVLDYKPSHIRVVVSGTELTIDMQKEGSVYVGRQAGLEFVCDATYEEIEAQKNPRPIR